MGKKVISAGHICIDITPVFPERPVSGVEDILMPGKLINMGGADVHTGGSVANTGLAMKILGADVSLCCKIGRDDFGELILNILRKYDAADGVVASDKDSTSYSVVLAIPGIDRIFLHSSAANDTFEAADVSEEKLREAALMHFGYPPLMPKMYENDGQELIKLMEKAHACGCATSLDLAAVDPNSKAGQQDWKEILRRTLPHVDIFVPSIEELCFMMDRDRYEEWQSRTHGTQDICDVLDVETDIKPLAEACMSYGCKALLLKCGKPGMYLMTSSEAVLKQIPERIELDTAKWGDRAQFERSYKPEKVRSGTGCGDTSIAAFLTAMLNGEDPEMCLHLAAGTGASCVAAYDALSGLKSFEELKTRIAAGWEKI